MNTCIQKLLRYAPVVLRSNRQLNCWTAAITKKHRKIYEKTYPTVLVESDGSSTSIQYHEPRKIIQLPLDITLLSEQERRARIEGRKPKTQVVVEEDIEDDFDASKYLKMKTR
uniref:MRpL55_0 protein n=1 Tax=Fopius arisanus TaxID=64838 RepID=A0A0C9R467_9HYME